MNNVGNIEKAFIKLVLAISKVLRIDIDKNMDNIQYTIDVIYNLFQVFVLVIISEMLGVLPDFAITFMTYIIIRKLGIHLHLNSPDACFWWSNLAFLPIIVTLSLVQEQGYNVAPFTIFFGVCAGLALSEDNKLTSWLANPGTERLQVRINRNKLRMYIIENFDTDEIKDAINDIEQVTDKDVEKIMTYKYSKDYLLTNTEIADRYYYSTTTVKTIDELMMARLSYKLKDL